MQITYLIIHLLPFSTPVILKLLLSHSFVLGIQPTGDITEYTATIAYELLNEGKEGRQKVDSLKMILKAEGMYT